jgi:hypothetical protein
MRWQPFSELRVARTADGDVLTLTATVDRDQTSELLRVLLALDY